MCESVQQVAAHVIGCDATITLCGQAGNFELNVMIPIFYLHSFRISLTLYSQSVIKTTLTNKRDLNARI